MLTAKRVLKLRKTPGRYFDERGLYLQVKSPRNASWLLRYERDGHSHMMGLGPAADVPLALARERARKARLLLLDGIDPIDAKRADRAARALAAAKNLSFEEAARQYFGDHEIKWRNGKHRDQFLSVMSRFAFPKIGRVAVSQVDTPSIVTVLKQKYKKHGGKELWHAVPETASRLRGRIENVLGWATVHGYRTGDNPARWKGHLENLLPARHEIQRVAHHAALPYADLPVFMIELRAREAIAARALEFLILCASRTGEVVGATWPEIDLAAKVWTIPGERMKMSRPHRVPLSDAALKLLCDLPREDGNPFVFIGPRQDGLSEMSMAMLLRRMGRDTITVHGFRSTFRDWTAEMTATPNIVAEAALAHVVDPRVEGAYRRGDLLDKRRKLMEAWARYCRSTPVKVSGDKVVPIGSQ